MKFTSIYYDVFTLPDGEQKLLPYVRLCPRFMNTEATVFWHGLPISHGPLLTEEAAKEFADAIEKFMERMIEDYEESKN